MRKVESTFNIIRKCRWLNGFRKDTLWLLADSQGFHYASIERYGSGDTFTVSIVHPGELCQWKRGAKVHDLDEAKRICEIAVNKLWNEDNTRRKP